MNRGDPRGSLEAARHMAALRDPDAAPEEIVAALNWLEEDDANRRSYEAMIGFMDACDNIRETLPAWEIADTLEAPTRQRNWWPFPAHQLAAALALVMLGLTAAILIMRGDIGGPSRYAQMRYATTTGEVRTVKLPDGSAVTLGGASAISISFAPDRRDIALTDGQAFFSVAHDAGRPFIVSAALGSIRAIGTQFDVHRTPRGVNVAVAEGTVHVDSGPRFAAVSGGMQVSFTTEGNMSAVTPASRASIASWRDGVLRYRSAPLSDVVADLNRYVSRPIIVGSADLSGEEITGSVRTDDIDAWLGGLATAGDMKLLRPKDGPVIIMRAQGRVIE